WRFGGDDATLAPRLNSYQYVIRVAARAQLDKDVLELATVAMQHRAAHTSEAGLFQRARAAALFNTGQYDAALSAAKGYYNVCRLSETADAIELIGAYLVNARPNDVGGVRRLKSQ